MAANKGLGKLEEAIEAYTEALSIKPDYAEAYFNMGNVLCPRNEGLKRLEEAIKAYNNMGNALKEDKVC